MRRQATIALIITAAIAAVAAPAYAATYSVVACADAQGAVNNSWTVSNNAPSKLESDDGCSGSGNYAGLYARDVLAVSNASAGASAQWTFDAPTGTTITGLSYSRWLYKEDDDDWQPTVRADGAIVDTCTIPATAINCTAGLQGGQRASVGLGGAASLSVGVLCAATAPITCGNGGTLHAAVAVLYGATVTLSDSSAPSLSNIGGPLLAGGYQRGSQFASFSASDNVGIRRGRIYVDGTAQTTDTYSCDFTFTVPCTNKTGTHIVLDTRTLTDGTHSVHIAASDPADNETTSAPQTITVDNGAPTAPIGLSIDGGSDRSSAGFSASWSNPGGQVAPIATAHWRLCDTHTGSCDAGAATGDGVSHLADLSLPTYGDFILAVWLEDGAGNVDPDSAATATLHYPAPTSPAQTTPPAPITQNPTDTSVTTPGDTASLRPSAPARATSRLRLTRVSYSRGSLVITGSTRTGATGTLSITTSPRHRFTRRTRGGRFRIVIRMTRRPRSVLVRYRGSTSYLPASLRRPVR